MFGKATKKLVVQASEAVKEEFKEEIDAFKIIAGVSIVLNVLLLFQNHKLKIPVQPQMNPVTVIFAPPTR